MLRGFDAVGTSEDSPWYVLRCETGRERQVVTLLGERFDCWAYLPTWIDTRLKSVGSKSHPAGERVKTEHALYPGYLFCSFDWARRCGLQRIPFLLPDPVVKFAGRPATLTAAEIDEIKAQVAADAKPAHHAPGTEVVVRRGPLVGQRGTLVGEKGEYRLIIELKMLGRAVQVPVDRRDVDVVTKPGKRAA